MIKAEEMEIVFNNNKPLPKIHHVCFACNPEVKNGLNLNYYYLNDCVFTRYNIPRNFEGFPGVSHGGIVAAILDETAIWAINIILKKIGITQNFSIEYLKPIKTDMVIYGVGLIASNEGGHIIVHSHIIDSNSTILVESTSTWKTIEIDNFSKFASINNPNLNRDRLMADIKSYFNLIDKIIGSI